MQVLEDLEDFAEGFRRLGLGHFLARVANQGAQVLDVELGVFFEQHGQRRVVRQQLVAAAFERVQRCCFGLRRAFPAVDRALDDGDFFFVQRAHFLAHELQRAAPAFVVGDALAREDGIAHVLRHLDALDAVARRFDELLAELLQLVRLALELRFGRTVVLWFELVGLEAHRAAIWIRHDLDDLIGAGPISENSKRLL